jgi:hypothetical protein
MTDNDNLPDYSIADNVFAYFYENEVISTIASLEETEASEYQGEKVTLNKPFRTSNGPKKFSVYVKNEKGNVVKVNFGDPNMSIKRDDPERRKSYRARHGCDNPGPKWKANYWSCRMWSTTPVSSIAAKVLNVGDMVTWNSSGGPAKGKIVSKHDGKVPNIDANVSGEEGNPAYRIRIYRDDKPTDVYVGHKGETLRKI